MWFSLGLPVFALFLQLPASDRARCQSALLGIPETSSYTFDADLTATSADLDALELSVQSPSAKAMGKSVHVGVDVVSLDKCCCGIFNAKEVRVRMDPVVRMCGLPPKGKGACTSTTHSSYKLDFKGERLLIKTPTASKATSKLSSLFHILKWKPFPFRRWVSFLLSRLPLMCGASSLPILLRLSKSLPMNLVALLSWLTPLLVTRIRAALLAALLSNLLPLLPVSRRIPLYQL